MSLGVDIYVCMREGGIGRGVVKMDVQDMNTTSLVLLLMK